MKKINELKKNEKIELLTAIADGYIDSSSLTPDTLIGVERSDWFLGLMMAVDNRSNPKFNLFFLGDAKKVSEEWDLRLRNEKE